MDHLISDLAAAGLSTRVKDALRALVIGEWQSEAYQHHQNFTERKYQDIKAKADLILNRSGAPPIRPGLTTQAVLRRESWTA